MRAVERGPLMWMMPLHLHVNQKSDYDLMLYEIRSGMTGTIKNLYIL